VSELQRQGIPGWMRHTVAGFRFCATMQLRTPMRILQCHGLFHDDLNTPPPTVADEEWQGIWIPVPRSWRQVGVDIDDPQLSTMSSEFGQVAADGGECLLYLIAIRDVVERCGPTGSRIADLECFTLRPQWAEYWSKSGGAEGLGDRFFPTFLSAHPEADKQRRRRAVANAERDYADGRRGTHFDFGYRSSRASTDPQRMQLRCVVSR